MTDFYQRRFAPPPPKPKKDLLSGKPKVTADVLLCRAIRRALRECGPQKTGQLVASEFRRNGLPKELRRHL